MTVEVVKSSVSATETKPINGETADDIAASLISDQNDFNNPFISYLFNLIFLLYQIIKNHKSRIDALTRENTEQAIKIAELSEKANQPTKTSDNSSIPPSKDNNRRYPKNLPKLDENGKPIKGKPGAKPGHKAHHRKKATPRKKTKEEETPLELPVRDIPTEEIEILPESTACPDCGSGTVHFPDKDHHKEQIEIVPNPLVRKQYTIKAFKCTKCGKTHYGDEPASLATGLLGPFLISLLAYLKCVGHMSFTSLQRFLGVFGLNVCRGFICKCLDKCSEALESAYNELKEALPKQKIINIDETSHKEFKKRLWTWVFRAKKFAFFAIKVDRAASVLIELLGETFKGIIGSCFTLL
jgi:transposase